MSLISRAVLSLLLVVAIAAPLAAVDLAQLPADQHWLVHVDVQAVLKGQLGGWLAEKGTPSTAKARLALFTAVTGIDLARDLDSVTMCGADASDDGALIIIRGRFDGGKLGVLAQAADGYSSHPYGQHGIAHWTDNRDGAHKAMNGCLVNPGLLLIAQRQSQIEHALDIVDGKATATAASAGLFDAARLNAGAPLLTAAAADMPSWTANAPRAAMWSQVRSLMGSVAEDGQDLVFTASVVGIDAAAITQVRDLLQGLVALAKFGKPKDGDEIGPAIIASAQFTLDGSTLTARARCPMAALLHALDRGQPAAPASGAAAAAGTPVK